MQKFIIYYRVSTYKQGRSGLGLEAQEAAVQAFLATRTGYQVVGEFREIESGRKSDRRQLAAAMLMCRMTRGTLLIAKLDRLARDAHFLLGLEKAGVEFVAADMPFANRLTIGIMALVAEEEAKAVSARTKAALAARKARGLPLGNPATLRPADPAGAARAGAAWSNKAADHARELVPVAVGLRQAGLSLRAIARELHGRGYATVRGGQWTADSVARLLKRADPETIDAVSVDCETASAAVVSMY